MLASPLVQKKLPVMVLTGMNDTTKNDVLNTWHRHTKGNWAVLSNAVCLAKNSGHMRFTLGGCACCTGRVALMTALTKVLREFRRPPALLKPNILPVQGVVIELPASGDSAAMMDQLNQPLLADLIDVQLVLHVRSTRGVEPSAAEIAMMNTAWLIADTESAVKAELLEKVSTCSETVFLLSESFAHDVARHLMLRNQAVPSRVLFDTKTIFNRTALRALLAQNTASWMGKGVFRTEREWYGYENGQWCVTRFRRYSYWQGQKQEPEQAQKDSDVNTFTQSLLRTQQSPPATV